jgi:hypothetical protein
MNSLTALTTLFLRGAGVVTVLIRQSSGILREVITLGLGCLPVERDSASQGTCQDPSFAPFPEVIVDDPEGRPFHLRCHPIPRTLWPVSGIAEVQKACRCVSDARYKAPSNTNRIPSRNLYLL